MSIRMNSDRFKRRLKALKNVQRTQVLGKTVMSGAFLLEGKVKESIGAEKHGIAYGTHVASAPGETPAVLTGNLLNSIGSRLIEASDISARAAVGTNAEYAAALEYGTSHIAARPYLRPAVDENAENIVGAMETILQQEIEAAWKTD
jgi:HK97 gp10 family phage protein